MFISMPKDFYVPVIFSDEFNLNEENGQIEFDSEKRKEINNDIPIQSKDTLQTINIDAYKKENEKILKLKNDIYSSIDNEYVAEVLNS